MHILVATDGAIDTAAAVEAVARWYADGDTVEVFTAINIPTDLLKGLGDSGVALASQIALEAGQGLGDRAAEQLAPASPQQSLHGDSPMLKALESTARHRTAPIVESLAERGINAKHTWATSENKTAKTILAAVARREAGVVVIGSHGQGRFEGLLGSTGTKIVRMSPTPVIVIRPGA